MVTHIVMWNFKDSAEGNEKKENMKLVKEKLEGLAGKIDGLLEIHMGFNFNPHGFDACLNSKFESREALAQYDSHPLHQEIRKFVRAVISERAVADYE